MSIGAQATGRNYLNADYGIRSWLLTTDHKRIALLYLASITVMFVLGGIAALLVRLELPGVQSDEVRVNVDGDMLRVSGVRRVPAGSDVRRLHQMEIAFGPFERTIRISQAFERDNVTAHLEDGFLEVTIPKKGGRQIKVESR